MAKKSIFQRLIGKSDKNDEKNAGITNQIEAKKSNPDETIAAISMALHLYLNSSRDEESEVITIDMPSAHYSPWALKSLVMKRVVRK